MDGMENVTHRFRIDERGELQREPVILPADPVIDRDITPETIEGTFVEIPTPPQIRDFVKSVTLETKPAVRVSGPRPSFATNRGMFTYHMGEHPEHRELPNFESWNQFFLWTNSQDEEIFLISKRGRVLLKGVIQPCKLVMFDMGSATECGNYCTDYQLRMDNRRCEKFEIMYGCHMQETQGDAR